MSTYAVLLWVVPAVAAVVALLWLLSRVREMEGLTLGLARDVHRLRELKPPLRAAKAEMDASDPLMNSVWAHWEDRGGSPPRV